mgnify:CR=1 FL=1
MSTPLALIVDDEPDIRELLELTLGRMDIETRSAANLADAHRLLEENNFNLCLTVYGHFCHGCCRSNHRSTYCNC